MPGRLSLLRPTRSHRSGVTSKTNNLCDVFRPRIDAKINRLNDVVVPIADQPVDLDKTYFPFARIFREIVHGDYSGVGLEVFSGVPDSHGVSIELCCRHCIAPFLSGASVSSLCNVYGVITSSRGDDRQFLVELATVLASVFPLGL